MNPPRAPRIPRTPATLLLALALSACALQPVAEQPSAQPATATPARPDPESIGSTRNARVAIPGAKDKKLTFLVGSMPAAQLDELRALAPNITFVRANNDQEALRLAPTVHAADARFVSPEFLAAATSLAWVQAMSAGVDHLVPELKPHPGVVLTNMRAVHGPAIADHSFAMLLSLTRGLRAYDRNQAQGRWSSQRDPDAPRPIALQGRTMLVVGLGGIGSEIAQRAHGFGMRVEAIRRSDTPAPDYVARVGHAADLHAMLPSADVVAICLPLTDETRGMFGAPEFALMKDGSYLINIGRGPIVRTDDLVAALDAKHLAGACLDVTDPEPLPPDHPLWKSPRALITPHVAADAELTSERRWSLLRENTRRFAAGEPLLNVVDPTAGY
jgi:phosphoglycerate dehydrogenase-like enzyme